MRFGERTARGIVGGNKNCWALVVLGETRNERNSERNMVRCDMVRDIASSRASAAPAPDRKNSKRKKLLLAE